MNVQPQQIPDVVLIEPQRFGDARGWFSETFSVRTFPEAVRGPFRQDNQSSSAQRGTVRGLHCQIGSFAQGKLVRVLRGAIWDVALRRTS